MVNLVKHLCPLFLLTVSVMASLDFDYMSIKPSYNAGDFMGISIIQTPEADVVGDPTISLMLYDEFGKSKLQTIMGPTPVSDLPRRKPYEVYYWEIPNELSSDFELGTRYRLRMIYSQSKKGVNEPVTNVQERMVTIRNLKAVPGDKPNPAYKGSNGAPAEPQQGQGQTRPYPPPISNDNAQTETGSVNEPLRVYEGATWAYSMVKTLIVHLLV
ncbi:hypothetical protein K493DRAFT_336507 [Basidiobolus meristosporus CBS 931.73]|uniref:Velvet domain-containing protein n=1 Tax=Basidiobolus meristosporus CBS 931.73 TaxID=1314790 RepID=A0A1Y1YHW1_9FUNG|nr:hypothetical protein K493DRAFT_336507 [Basidiobolus meristosporus CBS 931.73]|eukprot:ORX97518.1 hypothetical protein K493DRAFT_336507 [Basidiobolus meristosporus CBS 931.73]